LILDAFDNQEKARNMSAYVTTNLFRFLLLQALTSIHITKDKFCFVPLQDFSEPWSDDKLYKKYDIKGDEIEFIESMIRPME
jgi:site-specific DNA-methyltransferase (adenine-specific)